MEVYIRADQIPSGRKFHNVFLKQLIAASEGVTGNAYFYLLVKRQINRLNYLCLYPQARL
jgi:hypothetical protein